MLIIWYTVSGHLQGSIADCTAHSLSAALPTPTLLSIHSTLPCSSSVEIKDASSWPTMNRNAYCTQGLRAPHHSRVLDGQRYWLLCACGVCQKSLSYDFLESLVDFTEPLPYWTHSVVLCPQWRQGLLSGFLALASVTHSNWGEKHRLAVVVWMGKGPLRPWHLKP